MAFTANREFSAIALSASTNAIRTGPGVLGGIFVSTSSSLTLTVYDGLTSAGTKLLATFTPATLGFFEMPFSFSTGLTVVIGGSGTFTVCLA